MVVNVLVEGQTEEQFIKDVLSPYLSPKGIYPVPTIVNTKIVKDGANFKGGLSNNNFGKFVNDINRLISSTPHGVVTTFIDYYALPSKMPGYEERVKYLTSLEQVEFLEDSFFKHIGSERFIPYIQLHEFEAFLFADPVGFDSNIMDGDGDLEALTRVINEFDNPEDINHGAETAPSKRILTNYKSYQKVIEGNLMVLDIGIEKLIEKCPHFNGWVNKLISLKA